MKRLALFVSCVSLAAAPSCAPKPPKYSIKLPELHAKLANGLRVIVLPDDSTNLVSVVVRYQVGSAEDPAGKDGLAHLVEHLMFQQRTAGPDKPPLGAFILQNTVFGNAQTEWDTTTYEAMGPKEMLKDLVNLEAVRMFTGCETIKQETFDREREVVRNEIRGSATAEGQALDQVIGAVYGKDHPYRPIGGADTTLSGLTLDDACKFMKDYYAPSNAIVVIAGNTTVPEVKDILAEHFAAIPDRPVAPRAKVEPLKLAYKRVDVDLDVDRPQVWVAWARPRRFTKEDMLADFMGAAIGDAAFFGDKYDFLIGAGASPIGGGRAPVELLQMEVTGDDKVNEALDAIWRSAKLAHKNFEGNNMETFRARRTQAFVYGFENLIGRSTRFADYAQYDPDGQYFAGELSRIRGVTFDDVNDYLKSSLDKDHAVVVVIHPKKGATKYQRGANAYGGSHDDSWEEMVDAADAKKHVEVPKAKNVLGNAKRFTLGNGMKVILLPTGAQLPVVTLQLVFNVGYSHESAKLSGIARLAAEDLNPPGGDAGAGGELASADVLGHVGAERGAEVGPDYTVFEVHGLNIYMDILVKGFERWLKVGDYSQEEFEQGAKLFKYQLKSKKERSHIAFREQYLKAIYGEGHPYARTGEPNAASVDSIGVDKASDWRNDHFTSKNATLIITGNFEPAYAESLVRSNFGDWGSGGQDKPVGTEMPKRTGPEIIGVEGPDEPILDFQMAYPAPAGHDGQFPARLIVAEMLSIRVGVARQKLGASYGLRARYQPRLGPGAYEVGGSGVDGERAGEVIKAVRAEIQGLRDGDENFDRDFVRARRKVIRQMLGSSGEDAAVARQLLNMAEFSLSPEYFDKLVQYVAFMSKAQVKDLIDAEIRPEVEVIVLRGPLAKVTKAFNDAGLLNVKMVSVE